MGFNIDFLGFKCDLLVRISNLTTFVVECSDMSFVTYYVNIYHGHAGVICHRAYAKWRPSGAAMNLWILLVPMRHGRSCGGNPVMGNQLNDSIDCG